MTAKPTIYSVLAYANLAAFPLAGVDGTIYVAKDTNWTYRWTGAAYVELSATSANSTYGGTGATP